MVMTVGEKREEGQEEVEAHAKDQPAAETCLVKWWARRSHTLCQASGSGGSGPVVSMMGRDGHEDGARPMRRDGSNAKKIKSSAPYLR